LKNLLLETAFVSFIPPKLYIGAADYAGENAYEYALNLFSDDVGVVYVGLGPLGFELKNIFLLILSFYSKIISNSAFSFSLWKYGHAVDLSQNSLLHANYLKYNG